MLCPWCLRDIHGVHFCDQKPKGPSIKIDLVKVWNKLFGKKSDSTSQIDKKIEFLMQNKDFIEESTYNKELEKLQRLKKISDIINKTD
jgi:hypothetical protein